MDERVSGQKQNKQKQETKPQNFVLKVSERARECQHHGGNQLALDKDIEHPRRQQVPPLYFGVDLKRFSWSSLVAQRVKDHCSGSDHCCGAGSIPGLGMSTCHGHAPPKKSLTVFRKDFRYGYQ